MKFAIRIAGRSLLLAAVVVAISRPSARSQPAALALGQPVEQELGPGQTNEFTVAMTVGQFLHVVVNKIGVEAVVTLAGPDGQPLVVADSGNGRLGPQPASLIAPADGAYEVRVSASSRTAQAGRYRIELTELHAATQEDRTRFDAETHFFAGVRESRTGDTQQRLLAVEEFRGAARLWEMIGDSSGEGFAFYDMGTVCFELDRVQDAVDSFSRALPLWRATGDRAAEAATLNSIAGAWLKIENKRNALEYYSQALPLERALGNRPAEALTLNWIGLMYSQLGDNRKALDYYNAALPIWRAMGNRQGEDTTLHNAGDAWAGLGETRKALECYGAALSIARALGNRDAEAKTLNSLGSLYSAQGDKREALDYFDQALAAERAAGDRPAEAATRSNIGKAWSDLGEKQKALESFNQALTVFRSTGNREGEATTLNNIGLYYSQTGEKESARDYYNQALTIWRALDNRIAEARTMHNVGAVWADLGEEQKALDCYQQALPLFRDAGDRSSEANTLNGIARVFASLGERQKALDYYQQTLTLRREIGDLAGEALALNNIGGVHLDLGEKQTALDYYFQALPLAREAHDPYIEASTLNNAGAAYLDLKAYQKALDYYTQALPLRRSIRDREGEATTLNNIGVVMARMGQTSKALSSYLEALPIARAISDPFSEGAVLANLMDYWRAEHNPGLAIFFGKQAVNRYQSIRRNISGLEQEAQQSYLATVAPRYRLLAEILVGEGRLAEAEQVLGLLKEQEYFDYVRRDAAAAAAVDGRADLNPRETESAQREREFLDKLMALGAERGDLLGRKALTAAETQRLEDLEKDIAVGNAALEKFFDDLAGRFASKSAEALKVDQLRETQSIMEDLRELPPGTVAIFTLTGEDRFRAILRTTDAQKAYEFPITAAELNRKVLDFRQMMQDPHLDPRPAAEELYRILIGPMARDLLQARARTLMWSLDGALRYLPLAALYDGSHYLVEQYGVSVMTLAGNTRLLAKPDAGWRAAGFGVTRALDGAAELPAVSSELAGIISTRPGGAGIMSGEIRLDEEFTWESFRQTLLKHYQVIHISSHFHFQPGSDAQSFLLLGDGGRLSMAELRTSANLFGGVQLLTLSACDTGMGDGREVEGFGTLAQRQGAKAVIASLWPVDDASTSLLMQEFYRIRESSPGITKLEALREAQLELLHGSAGGASRPESSARGVRVATQEGKQGPAFPTDPNAPNAHPYYWAPFFLMGNWL